MHLMSSASRLPSLSVLITCIYTHVYIYRGIYIHSIYTYIGICNMVEREHARGEISAVLIWCSLLVVCSPSYLTEASVHLDPPSRHCVSLISTTPRISSFPFSVFFISPVDLDWSLLRHLLFPLCSFFLLSFL